MSKYSGSPATHRRGRLLALTGVVVAAAIVAACQPAELDGNGKALSVISSNKQMRLEVRTDIDCTDASSTTVTVAGGASGSKSSVPTCMAGGLMAPLKGEFRDEGKNPAFPWGVSMNFSGGLDGTKLGLAIGLGIDNCYTLPDSVTGVRHDDGTPTCYFGLVTYRSTDTRHYPNTTSLLANPACYDSLNLLSTTDQKSIRTMDAGSGKEQLSGLALVVIGDSGSHGRTGPDAFMLAVICGPYAGLTLAPPSAPTAAGPPTYNYGTCPVGVNGSPYGGMIPELFDVSTRTPTIDDSCMRVVRSGNLEVTLVDGPYGSTTTTTTFEPTSTTINP